MKLCKLTISLGLAIGLLFGGCSEDGEEEENGFVEFEYENLVKKTSPWPMFRRTVKNNGRSPVIPEASNRDMWQFETGKGMFHAPAVDEDGTIYMGSADTNFYAIGPDGVEKWRFQTGEILDSSALIAADGTIFVPAGDGNLYALNPDGTEKWRLPAPGQQGYITWWEGHITMDRQGTLFAGNDDFHLHAISQEGEIQWSFETGDQVWSCAAFGNLDEIYFGCNDLFIRAIDHQGRLVNEWLTLGPVGTSPAVSDDGSLVVAGSFDGHIYGIDPEVRIFPKWTFPARGHFYGSAAIGADGTIYMGSADGSLYALTQEGTLKWAFDTLDPIRSSVAVDGQGTIYFGAGDGQLYALNPDGTRKWSYDTSDSDRNDLNGSPVIALDGVYIGGEEGFINFIPFDYCENNSDSSRCSLQPEEDIPADGAFLYYYTSGGTSLESVSENPDPTDVFTIRLVVREDGDTLWARIEPDSLSVSLTPDFQHRLEISPDGTFLNVIPEQVLDLDQEYTVEVGGDYLTGGTREGAKITGGEVTGSYAGSFTFTTAAATGSEFPLEMAADRTPVLRMRRLAVPQPVLMPTFNQIGFDSYNYLMGLVEIDRDSKSFIVLLVEGTPGMDPVTNLETKSIFVLNGQYLDSFFWLQGNGFTLDVTGVSIGLDLFRLSGVMEPDLSVPGLTAYAEVTCADIEFYGSLLDMLGLCHFESGKLIVNGTALVAEHTGQEGNRPEGITVESVQASATHVEATFAANALKASEHLPVILMVDPQSVQAIELDYGLSLERVVGQDDTLAGVRLALPDGFVPSGKKVVVLLDMFPLHTEVLP
jgi:outer membrane protein assembly factor BamB